VKLDSLLGMRDTPPPSVVGHVLLAFSGYAAASLASPAFIIPASGQMLVRPTAGVLLVALAITSAAEWPLLLLAAAFAALVTHLGLPLWPEASGFPHDAVLALLSATLLRRLAGGAPRVDRLRGMVAFVAAGVFAAPAAVALVAAATGWSCTTLPNAGFADSFWCDFFCNALAAAAVGSIGLALPARFKPRFLAGRLAEAAVLVSGILVSGWVATREIVDDWSLDADRSVAPLPMLLWAGVRFGPAGAGGALLLLTLTLLQTGLRNGLQSTDGVGELQTFLVAVAVPILLVAALVEERAAALRQLKLGDTRLRLALEASDTGTWEWRINTGEVSWSGSNYRMLGVPPGTPLGSRLTVSLIHPDDRHMMIAATQVGVRDGAFAREVRVVRPDGQELWLNTVGRAFPGPGAAAESLIGVNVDITAYKRAELAWKASDARAKAILTALPDLMFVQDGKDGRYLEYYAPDPTRLVVPPEQFLGRTMAEVLPPEMYRVLAPCVAEAMETGGPAVAEYSLVINGEEHDYEARVVRCGADSVLSIVRDITAWRRAQAALTESEEALRALTARLLTAHEEERSRVAREIHDAVGQQVATLSLEVGAVQRRAGPACDAEDFAGLHRMINELAGSIRGISHRMHPAVLEFAGLAAALRSHCDEVGAGPGVRMHLQIGSGVESTPRDAALAIYRITQEALRNVARHADANAVWVTVRRRASEVRLTVRDDGRGIDLTARGRAGLGFVIMRERARLLGGTLRVASLPGRGTEIEVRIPIPRQAPPREAQAPAESV
jgi:signal transduction histidine kinase